MEKQFRKLLSLLNKSPHPFFRTKKKPINNITVFIFDVYPRFGGVHLLKIKAVEREAERKLLVKSELVEGMTLNSLNGLNKISKKKLTG